MEKVVITQHIVGLLYMQVCAEKSATDEEILAVCNSKNPSGTTGGWGKVWRSDDEFCHNIGPVPCNDYPDRIHYLASC